MPGREYSTKESSGHDSDSRIFTSRQFVLSTSSFFKMQRIPAFCYHMEICPGDTFAYRMVKWNVECVHVFELDGTVYLIGLVFQILFGGKNIGIPISFLCAISSQYICNVSKKLIWGRIWLMYIWKTSSANSYKEPIQNRSFVLNSSVAFNDIAVTS